MKFFIWDFKEIKDSELSFTRMFQLQIDSEIEALERIVELKRIDRKEETNCPIRLKLNLIKKSTCNKLNMKKAKNTLWNKLVKVTIQKKESKLLFTIVLINLIRDRKRKRKIPGIRA